MNILTMRTGVERYANRVYTSNFYLAPEPGQDPVTLTLHPTYIPHERIVCGLNGCFGGWEIGHVILPSQSIILGVFTKKIIIYDPHQPTTHVMIKHSFTTPGKKDRRYTLNYWGYNGGAEICELLLGSFDFGKEDREVFKVGIPLDKLPF